VDGISIKLVVDVERHAIHIQSHNTFERDDTVFYVVTLQEPIEPAGYAVINYENNKGPPITLPFASDALEYYEETLGNGDRYHVYETHAIQVVGEDNRMKSIHFQLENNQLYSNDPSLRLELGVDMGHTFLPDLVGEERFHGLAFFPASPDKTLLEAGVDASRVPQRTPLWFKLRGTVSGTKASKLCGFYVPDKRTEEGRNWSLNGPSKPFSAYQKCNMRFGSLREFYMIIIYLLTYPLRSFHEVGWCAMRKPYPVTWGASPDGYVYDPTLTIEQLPRSLVAAHKLPNKRIDITKGAIEFKASRNNCKMAAYYIPQIYMEMMALRTVWVDLVRYCEKTTQEGDTWKKQRECRVYRVYRNAEVERVLVDALRHALDNVATLQDVVLTEPFCQLRTKFQTIADTLEYRTLTITPEIERALNEYEAYRGRPHMVPDTDEIEWQHIDTHNSELYMLWKTRDRMSAEDRVRFAKVANNLITNYTEMTADILQ
jgi:hypothetical protein